MNSLEKLLNLATLGTDNCGEWDHALPTSLAPLSTTFSGSEKHRVLLSEVSALSLWAHLGKKAIAFPFTPFPPANPEDLPETSEAAVVCLYRILSGTQRDWLIDWLQLASLNKKIVSAPALPELLDAISMEKSLLDHAMPVLGKRGLWLAKLNPDWSFPIGNESTWESGTLKERQAYFRQLRRKNPDLARNLLEPVWAGEPASARSAWLRLLSDNLDTADEPFLEQRLDDKSKEVRALAADLLASLPESSFRYRMQTRLTAMLEYTYPKLIRKASFTVKMPETFDAAAIRDGVDAKLSNVKMGAKSTALLRMVSTIPPSFWESHFQAGPETLWRAAEKNEWAEALQMGWAWAATRHKNAGWSEMILRNGYLPKACPFPYSEIARALPPEQRATLLAELLKSGILNLSDTSKTIDSAITILYEFDSAWPDELSNIIFEFCYQGFMIKNSNWSLQQYAVSFVRYFSIDFCRYALNKMSVTSDMPPKAQDWRASIAFRAELLESFIETPKHLSPAQ